MRTYRDLIVASAIDLPLQDTGATTTLAGAGYYGGGSIGGTAVDASLLTHSNGPTTWLPKSLLLRGNGYAGGSGPDNTAWIYYAAGGRVGAGVAALTLSTWFKSLVTGRDAFLMRLWTVGSAGNRDRLHIRKDSIGRLSADATALISDTVYVTTPTVATNYNDAQWHFVTAAADYANGTLRIFVDGALLAEVTDAVYSAPVTTNAATNQFSWLYANNSGPNPMGTYFAGATVHHAALTLDDHQALYAGPIRRSATTIPTASRLYYPLGR